MTKGIENKIFLSLIWICLIDTLMDIFMGWSYKFLGLFPGSLIFSYLFAYGYFIFRQLFLLFNFLLIFVQSDTFYLFKKRAYRIIVIFPIILSCLFILSNIFTNKLFTISLDNNYQRGPFMPILYVYSFLYGMIGFLYLCRMFRYLGIGKWIALISTFVLLGLSAIFQFLHPGLLLEMLSTSFSLLLVHLLVYRSEEMFDSDTGLYNNIAFERQLTSLKLSNRSATVLLITFSNKDGLSYNFDIEKFYNYIRQSASRIDKIIGEYNLYKMYYQAGGRVQIIFNQGGVDVRKKYPELIENWLQYSDDSYRGMLDPRFCIIEFPRDFSDVQSLVRFCHNFPKYINHNNLFLDVEQIIKSDRFVIQENISEIILGGLHNNYFELYYQPIYDLHKKKFTSAEALIRLNDPQYGFLLPGLFIPAAESIGLILPIGNFVLEKAFEFVSSSDFEELDLDYIELNLSVEQLLQRDMVDIVTKLQKKYGAPAERINMEITESMAGLYTQADFNNIEALLEKNFSFSLDDYGTGYSNIKRAIDLPLSLVKLDKSLADIVETPAGETIIRNTISMMHEVGFKIVCEGVETERQCKMLEALGCDYIQGYFFAKPMSKKDFISFIKASK